MSYKGVDASMDETKTTALDKGEFFNITVNLYIRTMNFESGCHWFLSCDYDFKYQTVRF